MTYNRMYNKENCFAQIKEPTLWHYTSIDVLEKLIHPDGNIKATHYKSEDDEMELQFGRNIWNEAMNEQEWLDRKDNDLRDYIDRCECLSVLRNNIFVFCMTTLEDSPFHWKNYASGVNGVAIGINVSKLKEALTNLICSFQEEPQTFSVTELCKASIISQVHMDYCKYGKDDCKKEILEFSKKKMIPNLDREDPILKILQQFYFCEAVVPFFKREEFSSEKEVRICYSGPGLLKKSQKVGNKKMIDLFPSSHLIDTVMIAQGKKGSCYSKICNIKDKYKANFTIKSSEHSI